MSVTDVTRRRAGTAATARAAQPEPDDAPTNGSVSRTSERPLGLLAYGGLGVFFGVLLIRSQAVSWFRIYEMFRFEAFHMYGLLMSAVATAALGVWAIKRLGLRTVGGEPIRLAPKSWGTSRLPGARYWMGGTVFGLGWGLLGACPGPIVALIGGGVTVLVAALAAALVGTWAYAVLRDHLPH